jgi:transcriptional regulator of acetoin/glycerol metabolism
MARRVDELLSSSAVGPFPPTVVGCVDATAIDPGRPYALISKHFSDIVRIPALRYRVDDIGEIARSILDGIAVRHSFRLSIQVVRIFEGYSWPGNISELKDVLKHVVGTKPFGMIQPADLPALQFHTISRKLSPLDMAQCDTIIQALYEAGGNRYEAAVLLGISRSSLYRKIDAFGISYIG